MPAAFNAANIDATAWVAPNVTLVGDVRIGAHASVWHGCVLRADLAPIIVGDRTNIQDLTVIHVDLNQPTVIGSGVTVGHRAVVHAATIGDGALIGIGAIVLSGAHVGDGALIGAGAVVTEGMVIPARHLALGVPARVVRALGDDEVERQRSIAASYVAQAKRHLAEGAPD